MPSTSPGINASSNPPRPFDHTYPGSPISTLQSFDRFVYRQRQYIAYASGSQLIILTHPNVLVQVVSFEHELVALAADDQTGKLLVAGKKDIWVLLPQTEGWTKIWWEKTLLLQREDAGDETNRLCWGSDGEALIGGSRLLSLFSTRPSSRQSSRLEFRVDEMIVEKRQPLWSKEIPSPVLFADFSPSGSLIASCARYDRLLKIWRRLSYEEALFDHVYPRHPGPITHVQWRPQSQSTEERRSSGLSSRHDEDAEVLFTVAADAVLNIWRTANTHDVDIIIRFATIDLVSSIPQSPGSLHNGQAPPPRFFFVLPSDQFCAAVKAAVGVLQQDEISHTTEHLNMITSQEPDVVVSFDGYGKMSAWGLQNVGHKRRPGTPVTPQAFHVTHAEDLEFKISPASPAILKPWIHENKLNLLVHILGGQGQIQWWEGKIQPFFALSTPGPERLACRSTWLGHTDSILDITTVGEHLVSRSAKNVKVWALKDGSLHRVSEFQLSSRTADLTVLRNDRFVSVSDSNISLVDENGLELASARQTNKSLSKTLITSLDQGDYSGYLLSNRTEIVARWTAKSSAAGSQIEVYPISYAKETSVFKFYSTLPMNDSGVNGLLACTQDGRIYHNSMIEDDGLSENWMEIAETGVKDPSNFTASRRFAAIASSNYKEIAIIELGDGYVEHRQTFNQPIRCISAIQTRSLHNLLAIAFSDSVQILLQSRYSHHSVFSSVWVPVKNVSINEIGIHIDRITWLPQGTLVASAGNGLYLSHPSVSASTLGLEIQDLMSLDATSTPDVDLQRITEKLQAPLPVWHPELLSYIVEHGGFACASAILKKLANTLKFWSPGDDLDPLLDGSVSDVSIMSEDDLVLEDETIDDLEEQLEEKTMPRLCQSEHRQLKDVIHALAFLRAHVNGLDRNALRYLYIWKLQSLGQKKHAAPNGEDGESRIDVSVPSMGWKEIAFARQSTTQQPLLDILVLHYDNKITWPIARNLGVVAWLSDHEALEQIFEQLAQTAYRSQQPPDPIDASLYFLALHKKPTLIGLWRIAPWHKEQRNTMNFLRRDFTQSDARTAAKKNAYALMGKRRFEYSAAFFLLADDPSSATSLLAGQCEDLPLAIAVARLYSGDGSGVLRKLLEDRVMPQARRDGNRWLLSWCHTVLFERNEAAESLVIPLEGVRTWKQDEPATLSLYGQLRRRPSEFEYHAILRSARILRRMGLGILALDLVQGWEFMTPTSKAAVAAKISAAEAAAVNMNGHIEAAVAVESPPSQSNSEPPRSMLDGFSELSLNSAPHVDDKASREAKAVELLKKLKAKKEGSGQQSAGANKDTPPKSAPTQFKEPEANSLLDSFGF